MKNIVWLKDLHQKMTALHLNFLQQQQNIFLRHLDLEKKIIKQTALLLSNSAARSEELMAKPLLTREQLIIHATGKLFDIFGAEFEKIDEYHRRIRLPAPPLFAAR